MKKGISLVALVITIIVMIILTTVAILSVSENGIFERARYARYMSDWRTFQDDLTLKLMNDRLNFEYDSPVYVIYDPDNPEPHYAAMKEQIPSFTEKYKDVFEIQNDEVVEIRGYEPVVAENTNDWIYTVDETTGEATITGYVGVNRENITIPNTLVIDGENVKVKNISNLTFKDLEPSISGKLTISDGIIILNATGTVMSDYQYLFFGVENITSLKIGNSVKNINFSQPQFNGITAYDYCPNLREITLGNNCSVIGFQNLNCDKIDIGYNLTLNGGEEFINYSENNEDSIRRYLDNNTIINIKSIKQISSIGSFKCCKNINVTLASTVTQIPYRTFFRSSGNINIEGALIQVGGSAFRGCTGLTGIVNFADGVLIGSHSFADCIGLKSIVISNRAILDSFAFQNCASLKSVTIGEESELKKYAFEDCIGLTSITISNGVMIGERAFQYCTSLKDVTIGEESEWGYRPFFGCKDVNIIINGRLKSIEETSFMNCTSVTVDNFDTEEKVKNSGYPEEKIIRSANYAGE